ncbi:unnamed protein product [Paramecium sonneborni]|nr:unnamed protein product [Paramecium sonneborni]
MKRMLVVDPEKRISWNELFKDYLSQMIVYPQSETILINYTFEKDKKVQNIFNYFIYISDILQFIRYLMRDVYSLNSIVQFSKSQYFHYTLITVKYMLNEINFYLRILKGQNLMSILMLPSDFNLFKQSNKFEKVLRNFQSNEKNLQSFYTQIKRRYDEYLQSSKKREKQQLELYEQGFLQNENDQKFFEVFNQIYLKIIHHIRSKFNQIQVKVEVKDNLFRTLIKLLNCLQPLGFTHKKLESFQLIQKLHSSLNLEKEFVQLYAKILRSEK